MKVPLVCAALSVLASFSAFGLSVEQTQAGTVIRGPRRGHVAYAGSDGRWVSAGVIQLDGEGKATVGLPVRVIVVDVDTGERAASPSVVMRPLPDGTVLRGPEGKYSVLVLPGWSATAALWVRPGAGAWKSGFAEFTDEDGDLGSYQVGGVGQFVSAGAGTLSRAPSGFARGDVLVTLSDTYAFAGSVDAQLNAPPSPGELILPGDLIDNSLVREGAEKTFAITRIRGTDGTVSVRCCTGTGEALPGRDYAPIDTVVTFGPGEVLKFVTLTSIQDDLWATSRPAVLRLSEPSRATLGSVDTLTLTLLDDDPSPKVELAVAPVEERDAPWTLQIPVAVTGKRKAPVVIRYVWKIGSLSGGSGTVSIPAGENGGWIPIPIAGDDNPVGDVDYSLAWTVGGIDELRGTSWRVIEDDLPSLTIFPAVIRENGGEVFIPVKVSALPNRQVSFKVTTSDGTARAGIDYAARTGDGGRGIRIHDDSEVEPDETFFVEISDLENAVAAVTRVEVMIADDDALPIPQFAHLEAVEGNGFVDHAVEARLVIPRPMLFPLTWSVGSAPGTAEIRSDYTGPTFNGVTIQAGETSAAVPIKIFGDEVAEPNETFTLSVNRMDVRGVFTIIDDDDASVPFIVIDDTAVRESTGPDGTARFRVALTTPPITPVSVSYTTVDGTASAGNDYAESSGTVAFSPGEIIRYVDVGVLGDATRESTETFTVTLSDPAGLKISRGTATATITDDDAGEPLRPAVWIADASASEGTGGSKVLTFRVTLSEATPDEVVLAYQTQDLTATSGADYIATSGTVAFAAGQRESDIRVEIVGDALDEPAERFRVVLSSAAGVTLGRSIAAGTIEDDDDPPPASRVSIGDVSVAETDAWSRVTLAVNVSHAAPTPIFVRYATADGTATAGADYAAANGLVEIPAGERGALIHIAIAGDGEAEDDETFTIALSTAQGGVITDGTAAVFILDDDRPGAGRRRSVRQ